jgi:16S rRNA (guanine(966)-N(2))-methyltransferase RsmD
VRVIAGKYKGFRFPKAKGFEVRPTTDRARESLFNKLHHSLDLDQLTVVDGCAGTGSVSLEFLSRGASVKSIDLSNKSIAYLKKIKESLPDSPAWTIVKGNVLSYLKNPESADIFFTDPPYAFGQYPQLIECVGEWLTSGNLNMAIIEHPTSMPVNHEYVSETLSYGQSSFTLMECSI